MTGGLACSASCISAMMRPSVVSAPTRRDLHDQRPVQVDRAGQHARRPRVTSTGTDSPVSEAVSRLERARRTMPSAGTRSPGAQLDAIADPQIGRVGTSSTRAVGGDRRVVAGDQLAQRADRLLRAEQAAFLEHMADRS